MTGGDLEMRRGQRGEERERSEEGKSQRGVNREEERIQIESEGGRGGRKHCKHRESNGSLTTFKSTNNKQYVRSEMLLLSEDINLLNPARPSYEVTLYNQTHDALF